MRMAQRLGVGGRHRMSVWRQSRRAQLRAAPRARALGAGVGSFRVYAGRVEPSMVVGPNGRVTHERGARNGAGVREYVQIHIRKTHFVCLVRFF